MLDRKIAPQLQEIKDYELPLAEVYTLDNGIKVYEVNAGTEEVIKLEIIFHAGRWHEDKKLVSRATASLLREGSKERNGGVVAEYIDFYGGSIRFPSTLDTSHIQVYCMTKYLENILPVISEIIDSPLLPEKEFKQFVDINIQNLKVDLENPDTVAYRQITEMMYGNQHPYGYNSTPELYRELCREDLVKHYEKNYVSGNCMILVSGKTQKNTIPLINKYLGNSIKKGLSLKKEFIIQSATDLKWSLEKKDSLQSAIRIGKRLFDRHHPDYFHFFFLNTVLGGYFGSRLMQNLREEKGYTYNISSSLDPMLLDGYFMIGTEVHNEKREAALEEIYLEFDRLREEEMDEEELEMVRNYLLGTLLTAVDGAFNVAEVTKTIILNGLPASYYRDLIQSIKSVTAEDLQKLAQIHLQDDSFYEVIVG
jgi:zinc protease